MFTIPQIKEAHAKVKSGADFPRYMQDIIALGVISFETFVFDNHTDYYGAEDYTIASEGFTPTLTVSDECDAAQFKSDLQSHQQGHTGYMTFLQDCARSGIAKWVVVMEQMTCTYYDTHGNVVLTETIPTV